MTTSRPQRRLSTKSAFSVKVCKLWGGKDISLSWYLNMPLGSEGGAMARAASVTLL